MRAIIRKTALYILGLYTLTTLYSGVTITGGPQTFLVGGFVLAVLFFLLRPILIFLTLPLQFATLGIASVLVNALILFILTKLITQISISGFLFQGFSGYGILLPKLAINVFFAYILSALTLSIIVNVVSWVFEK